MSTFEGLVVAFSIGAIVGILFGWNNGRKSLLTKFDAEVALFKHTVSGVERDVKNWWASVKDKLHL